MISWTHTKQRWCILDATVCWLRWQVAVGGTGCISLVAEVLKGFFEVEALEYLEISVFTGVFFLETAI